MPFQSAFHRERKMIIKFYKLDEKDLQPSQLGTYKESPGVYYYPSGEVAPREVAAAAGFDVEGDVALAESNEEMATLERESAEKLANARAKIKRKKKKKQEVEVAVSSDGPPIDTDIRESPNLRMQHAGGKSWNVVSKADDSMLAQSIEKGVASKMLHDDIYVGAS